MKLPRLSAPLNLFLAVALLSGCDGPAPTSAPVVASRTPMASNKLAGDITTRVLVDKSGTGTIEFRTGSFAPATNTQQPDGWFSEIHYKVFTFDGRKWKEVLNREVHIDAAITDIASYAQVVPARNGDTRVSLKAKNPDKHDAADLGPFFFGSCNPSPYLVTVEAHLRGLQGDPKLNDEVRDTAAVVCAPDVGLDVTGDAPIREGFGTDPQHPEYFAASTDVKGGSPTWFEATFDNTGPGGISSVGSTVTCSVRVFAVNADGTTGAEIPVGNVPYRWSTRGGIQNATPQTATWTSSLPQFLAPNDRVGCEFQLALSGVGTTKRVVVTANVLDPVDYDPSNNSVTADFNVVDFTPIGPPRDGTANGVVTEYALYNGTRRSPTSLVGIVIQQAQINGLTAFVVGRNVETETFELRIKMGTAGAKSDGKINLSDVTPMADAIWRASVADLLATADPNQCLGSDQAGTVEVPLAVNNGVSINRLCFEYKSQDTIKISVRYSWAGSRTAATAGAVALRDFLRFEVSLRFSASPDALGGSAVLPLTHAFDDNPPGPFGGIRFCPGDAADCPIDDPASYPPVKRITSEISG
jgi:hypothetical protein